MIPLILCDGLYSINFNYKDEHGVIHDSWDSSAEIFKNKIPHMVSITLELISSDSEYQQKFSTAVALSVAKSEKQ